MHARRRSTAAFSPPTLTKTWFHLGPVAAVEAGDWTELDLDRTSTGPATRRCCRPAAAMTTCSPRLLPRRARRDALRALRGQMLRTELYALDGTDRQDRPYTVTESLLGRARGVRSPAAGDDGRHGSSSRSPRPAHHAVGARRRPDDPVRVHRRTTTRTAWPPGSSTVAVPRGRDPRDRRPAPASPTWRPARPPSTPAATTPTATWSTGSPARPATRSSTTADRACSSCATPSSPAAGRRRCGVIGHSRTFYDGDAVRRAAARRSSATTALPVRTESLAFTDGFLDELRPTIRSRSAATRPISTRRRDALAGRVPGGVPRRCCRQLAGYVHYGDADMPGVARRLLHRRPPATATTSTTRPGCRAASSLASLDPLGADSHDRLRRARSAARRGRPTRSGSTTTADHDYRVLQPQQVTDPTATPAASRSPRPASSPPSSCAARTARATHAAPSVAGWSTTCSPSPSAASRSSVRTITPGPPRHRDRRPGRPSATRRS